MKRNTRQRRSRRQRRMWRSLAAARQAWFENQGYLRRTGGHGIMGDGVRWLLDKLDQEIFGHAGH